MKQEDIELLLKDLCARLPYGVKVVCLTTTYSIQYIDSKFDEVKLEGMPHTVGIGYIKPYLRPMSSMTQEEKEEYRNECNKVLSMPFKINGPYPIVDWLNAHHFDHRGLIEKGIALEAPEGMYKIE